MHPELAPRRVTRRGLVLAAGASAVLTACSGRGPARTLRLASGEPSGTYHRFGELLATSAAGSRLTIETIETDGSSHNVRLLLAGGAELGLSHADTAPTDGTVTSIGRVYENYLQVVVPEDSDVAVPADLRGRRIVLGAAGSGVAEVTGPRLLAVAGLTGKVETVNMRLPQAVAGLRAGDVDAFVWSSGFPTPMLDAPGVRFLPLTAGIPLMQRAHPGLYDRVRLPGTDIETIGIANLFLARTDLPGEDAADLADLLVSHASELIPEHALGTQFLDLQSLIGTYPIPLHPGAAARYRSLHG